MCAFCTCFYPKQNNNNNNNNNIFFQFMHYVFEPMKLALLGLQEYLKRK